MEWERYIECNPQVMAGRPILRGSQLPVDFVLGLFAAGWSESDVLTNYPHLTREQLQAIFAYAADVVRRRLTGESAGRGPGLPGR